VERLEREEKGEKKLKSDADYKFRKEQEKKRSGQWTRKARGKGVPEWRQQAYVMLENKGNRADWGKSWAVRKKKKKLGPTRRGVSYELIAALGH